MSRLPHLTGTLRGARDARALQLHRLLMTVPAGDASSSASEGGAASQEESQSRPFRRVLTAADMSAFQEEGFKLLGQVTLKDLADSTDDEVGVCDCVCGGSWEAASMLSSAALLCVLFCAKLPSKGTKKVRGLSVSDTRQTLPQRTP